MIQSITLSLTPEELSLLIETSVRKALSEINTPPPPDQDQWFDLPELCNYLPDKPQKATVYSWVSSSLIPCHKGGKKLRFLKSDIDSWMKSGRKKTFAELLAETSKRAKR